MSSLNFLSIGILGGMGPEATAEFYLRLVRIFQKKFGCVNDYDYPEIYVYNLPLPEIVRSVDKENVKKALQKGIDKLQSIGSDFIVCPCNSANTFFKVLNFKIPYISVFDSAFRCVVSDNYLILGTNRTIESGEYQERLGMSGIRYSLPSLDEQKIVTQVVVRILAGKKQFSDRKKLKEIVSRSACNNVLLACTELPLLLKGKNYLDTLQSLAVATCDFSAKYIKKAT
ncbi:MAG: amino acid racemase [archaeon]